MSTLNSLERFQSIIVASDSKLRNILRNEEDQKTFLYFFSDFLIKIVQLTKITLPKSVCVTICSMNCFNSKVIMTNAIIIMNEEKF